MNTEFTLSQRRALAVFTLIALLFAAYFLRSYFVLIVVAAVGAYFFTPVFRWFDRRLSTGLAATCTLLSALLAVIMPIILLVLLAVVQISRMVAQVAEWVQRTDLSALGNRSSANGCCTSCGAPQEACSAPSPRRSSSCTCSSRCSPTAKSCSP